MNKTIVKNNLKISIEEVAPDGRFRLYYGRGFGWETFDTYEEAESRLSDFIIKRIDIAIKELSQYTKIQRNLS